MLVRIIYIAILAQLLMPMIAFAQRTPLACQGEYSAGLRWESSRWSLTRFEESKFVLIHERDGLTTESVGKALGSPITICATGFRGRVTCHDDLGGVMFYDIETKRGAIAQIFGGVTAGTEKRDSLSVQPFACQLF